MKVMLKVDHENGRIVMNRTFANLAANVFSEENKFLQGAGQSKRIRTVNAIAG